MALPTSSTRPFGTMLTAMVTPFSPDGAVDLDAAVALAAHLVDGGHDGLVLNGTTGESPTTHAPEKADLVRAVVDAVGDRAVIVAGAGSNDTDHSIRMAEQSAAAGAHGLLVVSPYYSRPSQEGIVQHTTAIADSTDLPVMVYDIPGRSCVPILPETMIRLADHPNIVALKDAKADFAALTRVLANTDLDVYSGDDGLTLPWMAAGAVGLVSVSAHVASRQFRAMIDAALAGDFATARTIHFELDPVVRAVMTHIQGAVAAKQVLKWQGVLPNSVVRLPLVEPDEAEIETIREDLAEAGMVFS